MANPYFQFKQFTVFHDQCAMKVTTDACLFGAWCAEEERKSLVHKSIVHKRVLDIGAGTGLLSLMVAQKNTALCIDAVEIDSAAATQAGQNVGISAFANAITIFNSDILEWEKKGYDVIIANPPFYEKEIPSAQRQKNVAHHSEGLLLEDLFQIIREKLTDKGRFYLLLPYKRKTAINRLLESAGLYVEQEIIVKPTSEQLPFRLMIKGSKQVSAFVSNTLAIYTADKQYTPEFITLLKDYYLYL